MTLATMAAAALLQSPGTTTLGRAKALAAFIPSRAGPPS